MYVFLLFCTLLIPVSMIVIGRRYQQKPPKKINAISGYRTTMSMINDDTWSYSHKFIGKLWFIIGIILFFVTMIIMAAVKENRNYEMIAVYLTFIQLTLVGISIVPTEIKLHKVFDFKGNRK